MFLCASLVRVCATDRRCDCQNFSCILMPWGSGLPRLLQCNARQGNAMQFKATQFWAWPHRTMQCTQCNSLLFIAAQFNAMKCNSAQRNSVHCKAKQAKQDNAMHANSRQCNSAQCIAKRLFHGKAAQCNAFNAILIH